MLAMAAVLVLSCVGMASAVAEDHLFIKLIGISNVSSDTSGDVTTISFDVTASYETASKDDKPIAGKSTTDYSDGWFKNANLAKWVLGGSSNAFTPTSFTVTTTSGIASEVTPGSSVDDPYYLMKPFAPGNSPNYAEGSYTFRVVAKGKLEHPDEPCQIRVSLFNAKDPTNILDNYTSGTTEVNEVAGAEAAENEDPIDYDPRNPNGRRWDGINPILSQDISGDNKVYGKAKPKLGKIDKADLTFTPGDSNDKLVVKIAGPVTKVDVYIAAKDAKKLYPASADKITKDIQLNRENIATYSIPFRITSYDFASSASGSDAKAVAKAWKSVESTVTLSFNGAHLEYKGFPITFAMSNTNNSSKPTKKAVKLNIGTTFSTPGWVGSVTSREITDSLDVAEKMVAKKSWDKYVTKYSPVRIADKALSIDNYYVTATSWDITVPGSYDVVFQSNDKAYYVVPQKFYLISTDNITVVDSEDNTTKQYVYTTKWGKEPVYYYHPFGIPTPIVKGDKPEAAAAVGGDSVDSIDETFTVSADFAPYAITVKPDPTKDSAKLGKFFAAGYKVTVVQPVYDFLGNVKTNGYVTIQGVPSEKTKETKLGFTLTATNPSTKKKAAAKVTAMGKIVPYFDKTKTSGDREYITTKTVQAGKAPSAKFKAKGSKTISYYLGNYYLDDGELVEDEMIADEYKYDTLAAKLAKLGLSFDASKGIVALEKNKTNPTLNEAGDAYEPLDIVVTAANNVGTSQVWANIGITGAKPAVEGKEVAFAATDAAYSYKTFALKVGKDPVGATTTTANVKAAEDGSALAAYGLAMVDYQHITYAFPSTDKYAGGAALPAGWTPSSKDYAIVSGDSSEVTSSDGRYSVNAGHVITIYNGKTYTVISTDESLKNQGIIQIVDYSKFKGNAQSAKGVKVSVKLENFGAEGKGSIKVTIPEPTAGNSGALPGSVKALANNGSSTSATVKKTNGTAGYAYNNGTAPEAEPEESAETTTVTIGAPRTAADLTAGQKAYLAAKGYKVIAVLPEVSATADGQQEFAVELDENAPEGAKMVYIPFPQNAQETEDDSIADFYGADGEAIEEVPAEKEITVAPWLRADVVYQPVIAAEAE